MTLRYNVGPGCVVDTSKLKDNPVTIKEGCTFSIKIQFRVQREIVSGLRYNQKCKKMGLKGLFSLSYTLIAYPSLYGLFVSPLLIYLSFLSS